MADTTPGSAYIAGSSFGTSNESVAVIYDRVRIREVRWDYVANTCFVYLDYGREDPLDPPNHEFFQKNAPHQIVDLATGGAISLNGLSFTRTAGTHYTTLKAAVSAGTITLMENIEDVLFVRLQAMGFFTVGAEG